MTLAVIGSTVWLVLFGLAVVWLVVLVWHRPADRPAGHRALVAQLMAVPARRPDRVGRRGLARLLPAALTLTLTPAPTPPMAITP